MQRRHKSSCIRQDQESTLACEDHRECWSGEKIRILAIDCKRSALEEATRSSSQE
jgi:hypothetical protein